MFRNVSFFVTIKNENDEIVIKRLKLERQAQIKLTPLFIEGSKTLLELERVAFNGNYKPDEGEVHEINNFSIPDEIVAALREPTSIEELRLNTDHLPKIVSVFTGTINPLIVAFQKFNHTQYISNKGISLFMSNDAFHLFNGFGINILQRVDCLYTQNNLIFQSFHITRQIFDLSIHYREATDTDVAEFIDNPSIYVQNRLHFFTQADSWVRRKIALIKDTNTLEKYTATQICEKAASYGLSLEMKIEGDKESIVLPEDKREMKDALRFLDEEIYKGPLSDITYLTNSKRKYV